MKKIGFMYEYHFTYISRYGESVRLLLHLGNRGYESESETRIEEWQKKWKETRKNEIRLERKFSTQQ